MPMWHSQQAMCELRWPLTSRFRRFCLAGSYPPPRSSLFQLPIEPLCLSITVAQFLFTALTCLFYTKCNRLKARVVIYPYNHHVRLLSPEPLVFDTPKPTRSEEPTLLCNHLGT